MLIQAPDDTIKRIWQRIPGNIKITFFTAFFVGIVTHLYMFTNTLPNHDEFKNLVGNLEWSIPVNGRWFSPYIAAISGIFSMPWVNGLIAITFLTISVCLVISIARVTNYYYCALISGIMVTIPVVAAHLNFMGVATASISSIMLACIAAYIAANYKFGYVYAVIPLVFSIAVYQVSISVIAALFILVLILDVLNNQVTWQKIVLQGSRFVGTLVVGMVIYLLSIRIMFPDGLSTYQGLNQIGQVSIANIPDNIFSAYYYMRGFFLRDSRNFHYSFMSYFYMLSFIACGVLVVLWCIKKKLYKEPVKLILLAVLLVLLPLGCNIIYLMEVHTIHDVMIYSTVLIPVFLLIIVDLYYKESNENIPETQFSTGVAVLFNIIPIASAWIISITIALSIFNYWIVSNQAYFKLNISYQVTYAQSILLVSRIQNIPGYTYDKDIVIVGSPHVPEGIPELQDITVHGAGSPELLLDSWAYTYFLRQYLNFTQNVEHLRFFDTVLGWILQEEKVVTAMNIARDMPIYPDDGSIIIKDDTIYVRFAYIFKRCCWERICSCS